MQPVPCVGFVKSLPDTQSPQFNIVSEVHQLCNFPQKSLIEIHCCISSCAVNIFCVEELEPTEHIILK